MARKKKSKKDSKTRVKRISVESEEALIDLLKDNPTMADSKEELLKKMAPTKILDSFNKSQKPIPPPKSFDARKAIESKFIADVNRIKEQKRLDMGLATVSAVPTKSGTSVVTAYQAQGDRLKRKVLAARPADAPSIIEECKLPIHLAISQHQSPGDIVMLTAAIRDLHRAYPNVFKTNLITPCAEMWENNPFYSKFSPARPDTMWMEAHYPLINQSDAGAHHFIHGFHQEFERKLGLRIPVTDFKGDIHLSKEEKKAPCQIEEILGECPPFWIIDAGCKRDFTTKQWEIARYQQLVESLPDITFVQIGHAKDLHTPLKGDNVVDLLGKTTLRQLIVLTYHAAGVITPISLPMHLAAAVEVHPKYKRLYRPCVVVAGGREPAVWEAYTNHQYLHTCGMLPCCKKGGCWANRVVPLLDGDPKDYTKPCLRPIEADSGQIVPECMDMITVEDVRRKVEQYSKFYDYTDKDDSKWAEKPAPELPKEVRIKRKKANDRKQTKVINRKKK